MLASALFQEFRQNIHTSGRTTLKPCNSHQSWVLILAYSLVCRSTSTSTSINLTHPFITLSLSFLNPDYLSYIPSGVSMPSHHLPRPYSSATLYRYSVYSIPHPLHTVASSSLYSTHFGLYLRTYAGLRRATSCYYPTSARVTPSYPPPSCLLLITPR